MDDNVGDTGPIRGGWCLNVTAVLPPSPTVTVDQGSAQADPAGAGPIVFDVDFSEAVTGLTGADFVVGGTAGGTKTVTVTGSGTTYTASVAGMTTPGTVTLTLPAGRATSTATGGQNAASTSTDNTVEWFPPAPTVTVEQDPAQADPAASGPIVFDVQFSEPVTGLTIADFDHTGFHGWRHAVASLSGSGASYRAEVSRHDRTRERWCECLAAELGHWRCSMVRAMQRSTSVDNEVTWAPPPTVTVNQACRPG